MLPLALNSPGTHSNGKNGVLWIRMHLLVKDCGFPLPCYPLHPCMLYAMFTYIYILWKSTNCRINVGIGMPYRDGWGWFTGYLAVTCMENPWYFFAAIAGSWLASGSSRRGWQKSQQSQQKTSKSWSLKVFCLQWGVGNILYIYFFVFSKIIFVRRILSWRLNWWKFLKHLRSHKPNRSAVFFWEGKSVGSQLPNCRTLPIDQSDVRHIWSYIYVIYTDRQVYGIYFMNTKFLLYTYTLDDFLLVHCTKLLDCNFCRVKICTVTELCKQIRFPNCSNRELTRMRLMTLTLSRI